MNKKYDIKNRQRRDCLKDLNPRLLSHKETTLPCAKTSPAKT